MSLCCIPEPAALETLPGPAAQLDGRSYSPPVCSHLCVPLSGCATWACLCVWGSVALAACVSRALGGAWPKLLHGVNVPGPK